MHLMFISEVQVKDSNQNACLQQFNRDVKLLHEGIFFCVRFCRIFTMQKFINVKGQQSILEKGLLLRLNKFVAGNKRQDSIYYTNSTLVHILKTVYTWRNSY